VKRGPVSAGPSVADIPKRRDALLVLDVDEVILEFIEPFSRLLGEYGAKLHPESFRLTGNVRSISTGTALSGSELDRITEQLYQEQEHRQPLVSGVAEALSRLGEVADILFLTAMTPAYYGKRRALLDGHGLDHPMIATERSKGAVVAQLAERWRGPIVFVDDLPPNLAAVRQRVDRVRLMHLMANEVFRDHLPPLPSGAVSAADWSEGQNIVLDWLRTDASS